MNARAQWRVVGAACLALVGCGDIQVTPSGSDRCATHADCDTGLACRTGTCDPVSKTCSYATQPGYCVVADTCHAAGDLEPGAPCRLCDPLLDQFTFVNRQCPSGWSCDGATGLCASPGGDVCGDQALTAGEACDDGDAEAGDGCGATCQLETGWECAIVGGPCKPICGDGLVVGPEPCDDGNSVDTDACTNACTLGAGGGPCDPDPCRHGGTCQSPGGDAWTCLCPGGFGGDLCEDDLNECVADPCVHGTCVDQPGSYLCQCEAGWEGAECDQNIDDCAAHACENGTCVDGVAVYSCDCHPGWEGPFCDLNVDDCDPDPCVNGVCLDEAGGYTCECDPAWGGVHCDELATPWCLRGELLVVDALDVVNGVPATGVFEHLEGATIQWRLTFEVSHSYVTVGSDPYGSPPQGQVRVLETGPLDLWFSDEWMNDVFGAAFDGMSYDAVYLVSGSEVGLHMGNMTSPEAPEWWGWEVGTTPLPLVIDDDSGFPRLWPTEEGTGSGPILRRYTTPFAMTDFATTTWTVSLRNGEICMP